ncbi:MAG: 1-acyl-sn-glycerol-3-phosphate acyltransferase [Bacteroidaceae bacterium]|nr:1-acyl-sn-glycerol-3-phosphate acyltransferase [Bacteroidaceae bacterium]
MIYDVKEFEQIRPYNNNEVKQAVNELLNDRQFNRVLKNVFPWMPRIARNGMIRAAFIGVSSTQKFQERLMYPLMKMLLRKCSTGHTFRHDTILPGRQRYTFVSNHRDIVLDSAILDVMLFDDKFPTTCEIAIGDNLLIYPWIRTLVRLNKAFTVRRGISARELLRSSHLMSKYMHYAIEEKKENIWIAQREGRAKDSSDHTQESVLKMLALEGDGTPIDRLATLNIVPLTISYEYDPCDYLKAKEFQQKRDNPDWKKSKQDDLDNMKTGIKGQKGHIHYQTAPCINQWLADYAGLPAPEMYKAIAHRMDLEIHKGYRLFPGNFVALDMLSGQPENATHYTHQEKKNFLDYIQSRIDLIDLPDKDVPFLRKQLFTMYANPVLNQRAAQAECDEKK